MGLFEAYKFVEKAASAHMETMADDFRRSIRRKSDAEIKQLAHKLESPQLQAIVYDEMARRGIN